MARKIENTTDGDRMTLDEIEAFIADARAAGARGDQAPKPVLSLFGGKLKGLELSVDGVPDPKT